MGIRKSDIVLSLAGRDRGGWFYVLDTVGQSAWLADGKGRRIEKPKQKKLRHLRYVSSGGSRIAIKIMNGVPVTNNELRKSLAALKNGPDGTIREVC